MAVEKNVLHNVDTDDIMNIIANSSKTLIHELMY